MNIEHQNHPPHPLPWILLQLVIFSAFVCHPSCSEKCSDDATGKITELEKWLNWTLLTNESLTCIVLLPIIMFCVRVYLNESQASSLWLNECFLRRNNIYVHWLRGVFCFVKPAQETVTRLWTQSNWFVQKLGTCEAPRFDSNSNPNRPSDSIRKGLADSKIFDRIGRACSFARRKLRIRILTPDSIRFEIRFVRKRPIRRSLSKTWLDRF